MSFDEFLASFKELLQSCPEELLKPDRPYVFLSDLHMGDGGESDDLRRNRALVRSALSRWYLPRGYTLVLNGDIEELNKFKLDDIRRAWRELYEIFDAFAEAGRLRRIVGNHDLGLLKEKRYPYKLLHGLSLVSDGHRLLVFHGHQASRVFVRYAYVSDFVVRYLAKPLRFHNTSIAGDSRRRFKAERRIYRASKKLGLVSITGHTHRPLFESLSKYDSLRWSIEELLREYALPATDPERKKKIAAIVGLYKIELGRLGKKDMRHELSRSLYDEGALLIPCLFNSGCATGKHGMTAIEIQDGDISLAHWGKEGDARAYMGSQALAIDRIADTSFARYIVQQSGLEQIFARIELLAGKPLPSAEGAQ